LINGKGDRIFEVKIGKSDCQGVGHFVVPVVIKVCAFVISTVGPQSGPKRRDLALDEKQAYYKSRFLDFASLRSK
jgi:hypothetical protein